MPAETVSPCPFCSIDRNENLILHEGSNFLAMADHSPQAEAHLLVIPHRHIPHLASMPPEFDAEFLELKQGFGDFVFREYGHLTFWENGIFGQSVPHAHLHIMSAHFDTAIYADAGIPFATPQDVRNLHSRDEGHYFTVEHNGINRYLPPDPTLQRAILDNGRERMGGLRLLTREQRREVAEPYLGELRERWGRYETRGV